MNHGPASKPVDEATVRISGGRPAALPLVGLGMAIVGAIGCAVLAGSDIQRFYFSWMTAFAYWISIALGGLFFVLVLYVTRAGWGIAVRRLAEHAAATLPVFAVLFVPIWIGGAHLFPWWNGPGDDYILKAKEGYLNPEFFLLRNVCYFVVWTLLVIWFYRASVRQDASGDEGISRRLQIGSAPAIVLFALTCSFAGIDWLMALDPHWYSTMFGVYFFAGCLVGIFGFVAYMAIRLQSAGYLENVVTVEHYHDLGKLLFAFVVFWAYIAFSQYFLIWYGNLPEETFWFRHRLHGSWETVTALLAVGHFVVPFFFLMSRWIKRRRALLLAGSLWMLAMHFLDVYWIVMPNVHPHGAHFGIVDVAAWLCVGGVFLAVYGYLLRGRALVPLKDPRLKESLAFENV